MYHTLPPSQLILEGGPEGHANAWRQWYSEFTMFLKGSGVVRGGSDVKSSLLLELIGPKGYDIFSSFIFEKDEDSKDFEKLVKKFNDYFVAKPKRNVTVPRYNFFSRNQVEGESIDDYVTVLRLWAQQCQFDHLEDGLIKDRIVCGVWDDSLRDTLLGTEDLTLEEAVKICRAYERPSVKRIEGKDNRLDVTEETGAVDTHNRLGSSKSGRGHRRGLTA